MVGSLCVRPTNFQENRRIFEHARTQEWTDEPLLVMC